MKKINYYTLLLLVALVGCEDRFFERPESTDITDPFTSLEYANRVLNFAYSCMPMNLTTSTDGEEWACGRNTLEDLTDLAHSWMIWGGAVENYYSGMLSSKVAEENARNCIFNYQGEPRLNQGHWNAIRNTLLIRDNAHRIPDASDEERKQLVAEAGAIRAILYAHMFRIYGPVPWFTHAGELQPSGNVSPEDLSRPTAEAMVDTIVNLLDEVAEDLPVRYESQTDLGRITKMGAKAIKARLLLFAASPLFNSDEPYYTSGTSEAIDNKLVWLGGYKEEMWQRAKQAHIDVIDMLAEGGYELEQAEKSPSVSDNYAYRKAFRKGYYSRESSEILIGVQLQYTNPSHGYKGYFVTFNWGTAKPTQEFIDLFPMSNGTPISKAGSGYLPNNPYGTYNTDAFGNYTRDPRLYESVVANQSDWNGKKANVYEKGDAYLTGKTTSFTRKFFPERYSFNDNNIVFGYVRLPEIYLGYAEIMSYLGDRDTAIEYLNKVRNRVGLNNIENIYGDVKNWDKEKFLNELLDERAREFYMEEVRYYDMVRYKRVDIFQKTLHVQKIVKNNNEYKHSVEEILANPRYWKSTWDDKWLLQPFPLNEVNMQYGLIQNPGW